ncbi:hypothetical protein MPL1032_220143 [Mesorhizobium plurifarium]|uniref:Uncharacterized protein n=1 Tax=Mesorhizobium plurifarium TaxID=69974 RepID=A0A0K2VZ54_MESPL|nr:hypothetical protein MPL1032_220143 [Mesorhizobium plurifarium]
MRGATPVSVVLVSDSLDSIETAACACVPNIIEADRATGDRKLRFDILTPLYCPITII